MSQLSVIFQIIVVLKRTVVADSVLDNHTQVT